MSEERPAGLGRSTAVMAAGTATSRALGLVRAAVLVAAIGLNAPAADAFQTANWLPNLLHGLIAGGVINAVLVPQVVRAYRSANGQTYVDRLLTLSVVLLLGLTAILTLCAPLIIRAAVSAEEPEYLALATVFAFWCIPQVFFYGLYTLLGQVLNAKGNFGPFMWAPAVNNVVAILGLIAFMVVFGRADGSPADDLSIWGTSRVALLAGTATLGVVAQALVLLIPLYRSGFRYRPRWDWRGAGLAATGRVAGWALGALAVGQVSVIAVVRIAGDAAQTGFRTDIAGYNAYANAFLIFMLPHSLVTVSLLTALFTRLSDHAAARDTAAVRSDFSYGLRTVSVFTLFATAVLAVLALPIARTILPTVLPEEVATLPPIIVALVTGLVALSAWSLCQRLYYAYEDTKGLFRIQVVMAVIVVAGTAISRLVLQPERWVAGAAASIAFSYIVGAVWSGSEVWRRLGGSATRIVRLHVRAGIAAVIAGVIGWGISRVFGDLTAANPLVALVACVVVGTAMLAIYLGLLRLMNVDELDGLVEPLLRRLRRSMSTPEPAVPEPGPVEQASEEPKPETEPKPGSESEAEPGSEPGPEPAEHGGDRLDGVGRGTLLAGRYRLHQPVPIDLPGVDCWSARDQILDRPVRALVLQSGHTAQAQDGARRAALVSDARLLRILDVGDHEGVVYAVTEPVVGKDLHQLTEHGPLPADQARSIAGEAAAALEVARRRGVHHLSLRPSVLHVTPEGKVVVTGLALDGELLGHGLTGAKATSRADTVGLVSLLYLALTGRWPGQSQILPFEGADAAPMVGGRPVAPSELTPGVPNDLDTLCFVTLGPDDDGPHSPAELIRELEPWGPVQVGAVFGTPDEAPTATIPSGPWDEVARSKRQASVADDGVVAAGTETAGASTATPKDGPKPARGTESGETPEPDSTKARAAAVTAVPEIDRRPAQRGWLRALRPGTPPEAELPIFGADPPSARSSSTALIPRVDAHDGPRGDLRPVEADFDSIIEGPRLFAIRRFNPTPYVLAIMGVLVVIGTVLAWNALTRPAPPIGGVGGLHLEDPDPTDPEPEAPDVPYVPGGGVGAGPPVIESVQMLDPPPAGDNGEYPEAVDRAIDGDPTTSWNSRTYDSPTYGIKPGIGYAITLAAPANVSTVTLLVNGSGGLVEVRLVDPATPVEGTALASAPLSPETVLTFDPTPGQHVVLWFPTLPQTPSGHYRIELLEVAVS